MKHLRKYNESTQEFTFIDIVNILQDIIDDTESKYLVIYSATGIAYYGDDIHRRGIETIFKFKRYPNSSRREFKFRIDFINNKDYNELVDFLDEMKVVVSRFEDEGFYVHMMEPMLNHDSDKYKCDGVEYRFESSN